jgi:hypothetical protein
MQKALGTVNRRAKLQEQQTTEAPQGEDDGTSSPPSPIRPTRQGSRSPSPQHLLLVLHGLRINDPGVREAIAELRSAGHKVRCMQQDRRSEDAAMIS